MTNNLHYFRTIQSIADEIGIKRQTLYNRSKKTGVDISKKAFSDEEWSALLNNKKLSVIKNVQNVHDKKLTENDVLKQKIDDQKLFIEHLKKEIEFKNIQIDQAQKLQLIAQQRLTEITTKKKSFWKKLFS